MIRARLLFAVLLLAAFAAPVHAQDAPDPPDAETEEEPVVLPAGPAPNAAVEQPRPYGYFVGDVIRQRVLLLLDGQPFRPAPLPRGERVSNWLERRALRVEDSEDGRRWMIAEFQVINAPQGLTATEIPAWELRSAAGATPLRIGAWPITLSPLTTRATTSELGPADLRPDLDAAPLPTDPLRRRIAVWAGACGSTLALWLAWWLWRQWRASMSQPFARALHDMRRFDDAAPEAWHALHRAFDRTAGQAVQAASLGELFRRAPHLMPLRERIETFFRQSGERFFGGGLPADSIPVRRLCVELRHLEKRHER